MRYFAAIVAAFAIIVAGGQANAGFTASVSNSNSLSTGTKFLTTTNAVNTDTCTSVPVGTVIPSTSSFDCPGSLMITPPTNGSLASMSTQLTPSGTSGATSATLAALSCGAVKIANTLDPDNPMLPRFAVSYSANGPTSVTGSSAIKLDGNRTQAASVKQVQSPQTVTQAVWFKTTATQGTIMHFTDQPGDGEQGLTDKLLYITENKNLTFSFHSPGVTHVRSTTTINDDVWHFVALTVDNTTTTARIVMYIDGVAQGAATTFARGSYDFAGFWRLGFGNNYITASGAGFKGSLSNAAIWNKALSQAEVRGLYEQTSQGALSLAIKDSGAKDHWPLNDGGSELFTGTLPIANSMNAAVKADANPCTGINLVVKFSGTCNTVCSGRNVATWAKAGAEALAPALGTNYTLLIETARTQNYGGFYGLTLVIPLRLRLLPWSQTFTWADNRFTV